MKNVRLLQRYPEEGYVGKLNMQNFCNDAGSETDSAFLKLPQKFLLSSVLRLNVRRLDRLFVNLFKMCAHVHTWQHVNPIASESCLQMMWIDESLVSASILGHIRRPR